MVSVLHWRLLGSGLSAKGPAPREGPERLWDAFSGVLDHSRTVEAGGTAPERGRKDFLNFRKPLFRLPHTKIFSLPFNLRVKTL